MNQTCIPSNRKKEVLQTGTPQGSIISPLLFNIAMMDLPKILNSIEGTKHAIYADDITVWMNRGSPGYIEEQLQKAAHAIQAYASKGGMTCSSEKSELLVVTKHYKNQAQEQLKVHINGMLVAQRTHIKVLGLTIQNNGKANLTIGKLVNQCNQLT